MNAKEIEAALTLLIISHTLSDKTQLRWKSPKLRMVLGWNPYQRSLGTVPHVDDSVHLFSCYGRSLDTLPMMTPSRRSLATTCLWPNHSGSPLI